LLAVPTKAEFAEDPFAGKIMVAPQRRAVSQRPFGRDSARTDTGHARIVRVIAGYKKSNPATSVVQ
jgi:hypothetical protein